MKIYLVGGAVRDELLGLPVKERDWVVVGASMDALLQLKYKQVGKDFPVFLHPTTHEEYALARKERKTGRGYHGFMCDFGPEISLEEDLSRRDLTINAMAKDANDQLIDPHGGMDDLKQRWLRHVSPSFQEDPLRILRLARFAARYHARGFKIAPETLDLVKTMVLEQSLLDLTPERIWLEFLKALKEDRPRIFFETLKKMNALEQLFPALDRLFGIPQTAQYHPEIDTGIHVMMSLDIACDLSADPLVRFATLCHDLGKGTTPAALWPKHVGHEHRGVALIKAFAAHYKIARAHQDLALLASQYHLLIHKMFELKPKTLLKVLKNTDALRKPLRFEQLLMVCEADARGRLGFENRAYPQREKWLKLLDRVKAIRPDPALIAKIPNSEGVAAHVGALQMEAIQVFKRTALQDSKKLT